MDRLYKISTLPSLPVVLCTFLRACGSVGIIKTIGIYLEDITLSLGTTSTDIGIALGLFGAFSYFPAPLIAALYRRSSIRRPFFMFGTCLPATGVALTAIATSNSQIAVFLSLSGFGNCILMLCANMELHRVAGKNYNLFYSIASTGFGIGMVFLPFLAEVLHEAYGWRGGLLIMGALIAHTVPCAVAVKSESQNGFKSVPRSPHVELDEEEDEDEEEEEEEEEEKEECSKRNERETKENGSHRFEVYRRITDSLRQSDFYMDPVLNVAVGVGFVFYIVYSGWHSFLVPHALQRGISVHNTIIMTLTASIGNMFSRITAGVLANNHISPVSLHIFATLINISALVCDAFFCNYYAMLATSCLSAMSIGGRATLGPLIVRERASDSRFDVAFAVNECAGGLGLFIGGYLSGMIAVRYSSFGATFKLLAVIDVLVLLLITIIRCNRKESST